MTEFVTSADGARIAYDRYGDGPALILVNAAMQFRAFDPGTTALARAVAERGFTVVDYDRRGRGESAWPDATALDGERADIAALIEAVGGSAALFGSSSGGSIALAAAASGLPVTHLALWEVPLGVEQGADGAEFHAGLLERIHAGDREGTQEYYMKDMPPEWLAGLKASPAWPVAVAMTPSLAADAESLAWAQSAPFAEVFADVRCPVLFMYGEQTLPLFPAAADAVVAAIPGAHQARIPGANHGYDQGAMVDALVEFLRT